MRGGATQHHAPPFARRQVLHNMDPPQVRRGQRGRRRQPPSCRHGRSTTGPSRPLAPPRRLWPCGFRQARQTDCRGQRCRHPRAQLACGQRRRRGAETRSNSETSRTFRPQNKRRGVGYLAAQLLPAHARPPPLFSSLINSYMLQAIWPISFVDISGNRKGATITTTATAAAASSGCCDSTAIK